MAQRKVRFAGFAGCIWSGNRSGKSVHYSLTWHECILRAESCTRPGDFWGRTLRAALDEKWIVFQVRANGLQYLSAPMFGGFHCWDVCPWLPVTRDHHDSPETRKA